MMSSSFLSMQSLRHAHLPFKSQDASSPDWRQVQARYTSPTNSREVLHLTRRSISNECGSPLDRLQAAGSVGSL